GLSDYHIPESHQQFYRSLKLYYETENYFFVHAGVPDQPLNELDKVKNTNIFLWARNSFFESKFPWGKIIVHGHTPIEHTVMYANRINVDSGCVYGRKLTALQLPQKITYTVAKQPSMEPARILKDLHPQRNSMRYAGIIPVQIYFQEKTFSFKTSNYNEFGILVYSDDLIYPVLEKGQDVTGVIGQDPTTQVKFSGQVVRVDQKSSGIYYAIKFTQIVDSM
ncbi:MAG: PilZ domain-containing protein, partial [Pseudomonadota bacterium]